MWMYFSEKQEKVCASIRLTIVVFKEFLEVNRPEEKKTIQLFITKRSMI